MLNPPGFPLTIGVRENYHWLASEQYFDDLLPLCPDIVLGKYVVITSIDSGTFYPSEEEKAAGWELRNGIAYSPRILTPSSVRREGWDEWYVLDEPVDLGGKLPSGLNPFSANLVHGQLFDFINSQFSPHTDESTGMAPFFWKQFDWIRPRAYIAECDDFLLLITCDQRLFREACDSIHDLELRAN